MGGCRAPLPVPGPAMAGTSAYSTFQWIADRAIAGGSPPAAAGQSGGGARANPPASSGEDGVGGGGAAGVGSLGVRGCPPPAVARRVPQSRGRRLGRLMAAGWVLGTRPCAGWGRPAALSCVVVLRPRSRRRRSDPRRQPRQSGSTARRCFAHPSRCLEAHAVTRGVGRPFGTDNAPGSGAAPEAARRRPRPERNSQRCATWLSFSAVAEKRVGRRYTPAAARLAPTLPQPRPVCIHRP
eukprot:COSAG04_NODE_118_length_25039_cov_11.342783_14_plen_239_part_00